MATSDVVTATFTLPRAATAAVDWFLNQAIDRDAVTVQVAAGDQRPRPTRAGDNRRNDLTWIVSIDVQRARLKKKIAVETMKREGGTLR